MSSLPRLAVVGLGFVPTLALAQTNSDTTIKVTFGGFVDTYYAYDFGRPPTFDRSFFDGATFTTQPSRHDEFNLNLAYVEAILSGNRLRGRLAFQAGTSVQSNYAAEPTNGLISGPLLSRHIQEAYAGYQVMPSLWVDAGIYYSHMGMESWASKDNPTYTRSLVSEYSPYYSSGARAVWQATPSITVRGDVVNGWQNISETNTDKGAGLRVNYSPKPTVLVSYYNFFNHELDGRNRTYNGVGAKVTRGSATFLGELDYGIMSAGSSPGDSSGTFWGFTAIARQQVTSKVAFAARLERYGDPDQVNVITGLDNAFYDTGASFGIDVTPQSRFLWRTEVRGFFGGTPIFPDGSSILPEKNSGFIVSSFALSF
jgi:hypothetical protein